MDCGLKELEKVSQGLPSVWLKLFKYNRNIDISLTSVMPLSAICIAGRTGFLYIHHDGLCDRLKEIMFI